MSDADTIVGMQMSLKSRLTFGEFLFDTWKADTTAKFFGFLFLIVVLSFLTEALKDYKEHIGRSHTEVKPAETINNT